MFPELDRVLWIDTDTLVRKRIDELYNLDFEGNSFAGVIDFTSNPVERLSIDNYINSGVLMINTGKLKKSGKMEEYWRMVASEDYKGELPDQDALNMVFKGDIKIIEQIWNTFPLIYDEYSSDLIENSHIVHYLSKHKPWKTEDAAYFLAVFECFRSAKVFVNEYWDVSERAVEFVQNNHV